MLTINNKREHFSLIKSSEWKLNNKKYLIKLPKMLQTQH